MIQTNPTTNNKNRKKPAPFIAPGSTIPVSKKEIESRKQKNELLKRIGINPYKFTSEDEHENPYRVQAMILINQGKDIPMELLNKIEQHDKEYAERQKKTTYH